MEHRDGLIMDLGGLDYGRVALGLDPTGPIWTQIPAVGAIGKFTPRRSSASNLNNHSIVTVVVDVGDVIGRWIPVTLTD